MRLKVYERKNSSWYVKENHFVCLRKSPCQRRWHPKIGLNYEQIVPFVWHDVLFHFGTSRWYFLQFNDTVKRRHLWFHCQLCIRIFSHLQMVRKSRKCGQGFFAFILVLLVESIQRNYKDHVRTYRLGDGKSLSSSYEIYSKRSVDWRISVSMSEGHINNVGLQAIENQFPVESNNEA